MSPKIVVVNENLKLKYFRIYNTEETDKVKLNIAIKNEKQKVNLIYFKT